MICFLSIKCQINDTHFVMPSVIDHHSAGSELWETRLGFLKSKQIHSNAFYFLIEYVSLYFCIWNLLDIKNIDLRMKNYTFF